jgi:hypothetical protein
MPHKFSRRLLTCAAALGTAFAMGGAADARATDYFNIVNTQSGRALEATLGNKVKLAPPNKSNPLQQWRLVSKTAGPNFTAAISNRLLGCLRTESPVPNPNLIASLKIGLCGGAASERRLRWTHLGGNATPTPSIPGFQIINTHSREYIGEEFCFVGCGPTPFATLLDPLLVESDPAELGAAVKWQYKFATSTP